MEENGTRHLFSLGFYNRVSAKKPQHLKLSISKSLVNKTSVHLFDVVGQIFSHNCANFQTKYSNGHSINTFLLKVLCTGFDVSVIYTNAITVLPSSINQLKQSDSLYSTSPY